MRNLLAALCLILAAAPAAAAPDVTGTWLFDDAPAYPGVTMMQVERQGAALRGTVTTAWYGPIPMLNPQLAGDTLSFEMRNLNDPAHPTRHWSARVTPTGVTLVGDIWSSHVEQTGRRGSAADAAARAFVPGPPLPPLGVIPPDNLARTPPMGWSSWNKFADRIDDATIRAMADALVSSGLREAGYTYVNIDDGWQGSRDPAGVLHPNAKFPDMKALADYVHGKGLKLGLYTSPGLKTCAGYAGSYGHVAQDARTFAGWGVDYVKYDLCSGEWFYADADSVKRTYYEMGLALKATGRAIIYSLCQYGRFAVGDWGRSVGGHLWRTTGDITDDYKTMAEIGFDRNPEVPHAGPGGWNDPDMLEIGNGGMSDDEYRTHMTLWAMQAAPLIMGHDLRTTTPAAMRLLAHRGVIAIDQDARGIQGRPVRRDGDLQVWRKELANSEVALALFNRGLTPATLRLQPADAGLIRIAAARDVWTGRRVRADRDIAIPGHGVILLSVRGPSASAAR